MEIELACSLPGETEYLYAALSDFSDDGPRRAYESWLVSQGAADKATIIGATIDAYHSLDPTTFDGLVDEVPVGGYLESPDCNDPSWQTMTALPLLRYLMESCEEIGRARVEQIRDVIFPLLRPTVAITSWEPTTDEMPVGASRLWGQPDLPTSQGWPTVAECSDWFDASDSLPQDAFCGFVGQFAFADFSETVLARELPRSGGISVFTYVDFDYGVTEAVLRPWSSDDQLKRIAAPEPTRTQKDWEMLDCPAHRIFGKEFLSLPGFRNGPYEELLEKKTLPSERSLFEPEEMILNGLLAFISCYEQPVFGIGGYQPQTITGSDPIPNTSSMRLIGVPRYPEEAGLFYAIPKGDVTSGQFDRAELVWAEWD